MSELWTGGGGVTTSCLFDCERHLVCHDTPNWQTLPGATRQGKQRVGVENRKGAELEHRPIRNTTVSNLRKVLNSLWIRNSIVKLFNTTIGLFEIRGGFILKYQDKRWDLANCLLAVAKNDISCDVVQPPRLILAAIVHIYIYIYNVIFSIKRIL